MKAVTQFLSHSLYTTCGCRGKKLQRRSLLDQGRTTYAHLQCYFVQVLQFPLHSCSTLKAHAIVVGRKQNLATPMDKEAVACEQFSLSTSLVG